MGVKISELTETTTVNDTDVLVMVQDGETKQIQVSNLLESERTDISQLQGEDDWIEITSDYGTLYYKQLSDNLVFITGSVTGISSVVNITVPFTTSKTQVFLLAGSGTYYTKAYINANSTQIGVIAGTGSSSTTYYFNHLLVIN